MMSSALASGSSVMITLDKGTNLAMKIFFGNCEGRTNVEVESSVEMSLNATLEIFRGLHPLKGFIGIVLNDRQVLQLAPSRRGGIRVELLDTSQPVLDACIADKQFAESLIHAAADGLDVFRLAKANDRAWEHTDMR